MDARCAPPPPSGSRKAARPASHKAEEKEEEEEEESDNRLLLWQPLPEDLLQAVRPLMWWCLFLLWSLLVVDSLHCPDG